MYFVRFILLSATLLCLHDTCLLAQRKTPDEKTRMLLKQFRADYIKSKLDENPTALSVYFDDSVRVMTEFQKTIIGKSNAVSYHKAFSLKLHVKSYSRVEWEVLDLGSFVMEYGQFAFEAILRGTGAVQAVKGKYVNVWKRDHDRMLLVTDGWNYDHQLSVGDQLRFTDIPVADVALLPHVPVSSPVSFELAALNRLQEAAISEHDANIWSQFYADDAIFFSQFHTPVKGRRAVDEYLNRHTGELPVFEKLDIRNDRIDDLGEYVVEYASHIAIWRNSQYSGVNTGKDLRLWRREPNGSLKIFRHMSMYD